MAKINVLSEEICNRIAAGEVIDRPYSVVKELVENSLDAGATEIEIYIERGGKDLIKVVDNGCGIEREDMRTAFFSHATSKIKDIDDIDKILTLGFRGEALATIAAVSKVELLSVTEGGEAGKVECNGDFIGKVQPAAIEKGTQISVRNLFFNTPARAKFMKTDKKEEADITNFITRYVLGNPRVAFRYYIDGKLNLQSYGGGLEEAIAQVYGASFLPQCFKISADRNDIKIYGFIGNQNFFKANKTYQSLYLNGRYIINQVVTSAITNAYASYAMKRQYPVYVLFIEISPDDVDVNVHPNKADVRFVNNSLIYGTVYKVISSVLDGTAKAADFVVDSNVVPEIRSTFGSPDEKNKVYAADYSSSKKEYDKSFDDVVGISNFQNVKPEKSKVENKTVSVDEFKKNENIAVATDDNKKINYSVYENYEAPEILNAETDLPLYKFYDAQRKKSDVLSVCSGRSDVFKHAKELEKEKIERAQRDAEQQKIEYESFKYKGNLFNTYLIYEIKDDVYLIDQHAAHERLIYDRLREDMRNRNVAKQGMLVPYLLDLNVNENAFFKDNVRLIKSMGFGIEPFGTYAYRVTEVPLDLRDINLEKFFAELLSDISGLKTIKLEEVLKDKIATTACKHAVKGGMSLTDEEIEKLFSMIKDNLGLKCPHGRPVCVKLTKQQIEKMFKRIV